MSVHSESSLIDITPGLDGLPDPALALDGAGRMVEINTLACALVRYGRQELIGAPVERIVRDAGPLRALLAAREPVERATLRLEGRRADGVPFTLAASVAVRLDDEGRPGALCLLRELGDEDLVTTHRETERALRQERDLSRTILTAMHEGFALTRDGEIVAVNDALCALTGFTHAELVGARPPFPFWPPELAAETAEQRDATLAAGGGEVYLRLMRKTGERFDAEITAAPARGPEGAVSGFVTTYRDVSDRRRQEAELARQASSDDLTGLLNRRAFDERLHEEVARARHEHRPLSVALLDLDEFKAVNDAHGHPAGDRVLVATAKRLRAVARGADHLARVGEEEFAWILPGTDAIDAYDAAERARHAVVDTPFGELGHVTISVGLCELADAGGAGELYRLADVALYRAKAQGRNRSVRHLPGT